MDYFKLEKYKPVGETPPNVFYINLHNTMFHNDLICIIQSILVFCYNLFKYCICKTVTILKSKT